MFRALPRPIERVAIVLAFTSGACGALEGLDRYDACQVDCDASISEGVSPTGGDAREEAPSSMMEAGDFADSGADEGVPAEGGTPAESGVVEAGGADAASATCVCVDTAATGWKGYVKLLLADGGAPACVSPYGT